LACRLIAQRWGQRTLVRFYSLVGRSDKGPRLAVALAMSRLLHESPFEFTKKWREFVRSELS
jgi:hypothetical protein